MVDCRICINRDESPICSDCRDGSCFEKERITNSDRIRSMTDEELAEFLADDWTCEHCTSAKDPNHCNNPNCQDGILEWLQQDSEV